MKNGFDLWSESESKAQVARLKESGEQLRHLGLRPRGYRLGFPYSRTYLRPPSEPPTDEPPRKEYELALPYERRFRVKERLAGTDSVPCK